MPDYVRRSDHAVGNTFPPSFPLFLPSLPPSFPPSLSSSIRLRRDHLLEDTFRFIMTTKANRLRQRRCNIIWDREEG